MWAIVVEGGAVLLYKEGYLRTSSELYDVASTDRRTHLTNYCVQRGSAGLGRFEAGNTLSFGEFQAFLDEAHSESGISLVRQLHTVVS